MPFQRPASLEWCRAVLCVFCPRASDMVLTSNSSSCMIVATVCLDPWKVRPGIDVNQTPIGQMPVTLWLRLGMRLERSARGLWCTAVSILSTIRPPRTDSTGMVAIGPLGLGSCLPALRSSLRCWRSAVFWHRETHLLMWMECGRHRRGCQARRRTCRGRFSCHRRAQSAGLPSVIQGVL